jgi:hypothetical protein
MLSFVFIAFPIDVFQWARRGKKIMEVLATAKEPTFIPGPSGLETMYSWAS